VRILIVEDEPLIAMMIEDMVSACGHTAVGIASTLGEALAAINAGGFDGAILDIRLGETVSIDAADLLRARALPFVFTTGGPEAITSAYRDVPMLAKPFTIAQLESALEGLA